MIGAGYIAVELAGVFKALGTDTTLLVRRDRPLRSFDSLLVDTLVSEMGKSGLKLRPQATTKVSTTSRDSIMKKLCYGDTQKNAIIVIEWQCLAWADFSATHKLYPLSLRA